MSSIRDYLRLAAAIIISEAAGAIGAIFTVPSISSWYSSLEKPALTPPNWIFGPVWGTLFLLMGIAAFLVWRKGWSRNVVIALIIFLVQLALNTAWSVIFFGLHSPAAALIDIVLLWLAILATIIAFSRVSRLAAWLLVPYIVWVSFAGYLNFSILQLNRAPGATACIQEVTPCAVHWYA